MTAAKLELLQQKSVEVLESLVSTFPEKNGVQNGWKFEKAHSILHKVRELILFGWSENCSTQGPEHCHIDFVDCSLYQQQGGVLDDYPPSCP